MNDDTFDLDAAIAEAHGTEKIIKFAGRNWSLPATIPLSILRLARTDVEEALNALLGDGNGTAMIDAGFSFQAFEIILAEVYGFDLGKLGASSQSSNRAARRAKPTSNASTASISAKRARRSA